MGSHYNCCCRTNFPVGTLCGRPEIHVTSRLVFRHSLPLEKPFICAPVRCYIVAWRTHPVSRSLLPITVLFVDDRRVNSNRLGRIESEGCRLLKKGGCVDANIIRVLDSCISCLLGIASNMLFSPRLPVALRTDGVHQAHYVVELHGQAHRIPRADSPAHWSGRGADARYQLP